MVIYRVYMVLNITHIVRDCTTDFTHAAPTKRKINIYITVLCVMRCDEADELLTVF